MSDALWMGIDLGTQSVRVLVVDDAGNLAGGGTAALTSHRDGPRHEQDPEQWWTALKTACAAALSDVDEKRLAGLAVDATSGTIMLADTQARPLTPALMYDDGRASSEANEAGEAGGPLWIDLGYQRMQPTWALPKLIWLTRHYPELIARPDVRLFHQADLITTRLVGHPVATDAGQALKTGYHLVDLRWPTEVFDQLRIPASIFPDVVRPGAVLGVVNGAATEHTGIPAGTPVIAGTTDGCAAQVGAGVLSSGSWNSVLGTTLVLKGVSEHLVRDPGGILYCHNGPDGKWLPGGASSAGAGVIAQRFPRADLAALTRRAAELPPGPLAYPLMSPGERFPMQAAEMTPFVLGEPDGDAGMFAAYLLGLACVERLCLDYLDWLGAPVRGSVTFTGGATRNRHWSQLRADMLGRQVRLTEQAEAGFGMAVLAATVSGVSLTDAAHAMVRTGAELEPRPEQAPSLLAAYRRMLEHVTSRGWLDPAVTAHAHSRIEQ